MTTLSYYCYIPHFLSSLRLLCLVFSFFAHYTGVLVKWFISRPKWYGKCTTWPKHGIIILYLFYFRNTSALPSWWIHWRSPRCSFAHLGEIPAGLIEYVFSVNMYTMLIILCLIYNLELFSLEKRKKRKNLTIDQK